MTLSEAYAKLSDWIAAELAPHFNGEFRLVRPTRGDALCAIVAWWNGKLDKDQQQASVAVVCSGTLTEDLLRARWENAKDVLRRLLTARLPVMEG